MFFSQYKPSQHLFCMLVNVISNAYSVCGECFTDETKSNTDYRNFSRFHAPYILHFEMNWFNFR